MPAQAKQQVKTAKAMRNHAVPLPGLMPMNDQALFNDFCDSVLKRDKAFIKSLSSKYSLQFLISEFLEDQLERKNPDIDELVCLGETLRAARIEYAEEVVNNFVMLNQAGNQDNILRILIYFVLGYWPKRKSVNRALWALLIQNHSKLKEKGDDDLLKLLLEAMKLGVFATLNAQRTPPKAKGVISKVLLAIVKQEFQSLFYQAHADTNTKRSFSQKAPKLVKEYMAMRSE